MTRPKPGAFVYRAKTGRSPLAVTSSRRQTLKQTHTHADTPTYTYIVIELQSNGKLELDYSRPRTSPSASLPGILSRLFFLFRLIAGNDQDRLSTTTHH